MTAIEPNGIYSHFVQLPRWTPEIAISLIAGMIPVGECLVSPAANDERNLVETARRDAIGAVRRALFFDDSDGHWEKRESFPFICWFDANNDRDLIAVEPGSFIGWAKDQGVLNAPLLEAEYRAYEDAMYDIASALDSEWTAAKQAKDWMDTYVLKWLSSNGLFGLKPAELSERIVLSPETFASLTDEQRDFAVRQAASFQQWISTENGKRGMQLIFQRLEIQRELRELQAMGAPTPLERESLDRQIRERRVSIDEIATELSRLAREYDNPTTTNRTAKAEKDCQEWLEKEMRKTTGKPSQSKQQYETNAKNRFGVGSRAFQRAWDAAIRATGATAWSNPGRRRKQP